MNRLNQLLHEPMSTLTHVAGAIAGLLGTGWLLWLVWGDWTKWLAILIYGISLTAMFVASSLLQASSHARAYNFS